MSDDAFGGSARSLATERTDAGWHERRVLAGAIRLFVFALPILAAIVVVRLCSPIFPRPGSLVGWIAWLGASGVTAVATVSVVDGFARRLLPLATLFRMSLVFPDETPSRMKLALRTGTARDLQRRISEGETLGETADEAAQNLLVLLRLLNDHDRLTRGHSERVRAYSDLIAEEMELPAEDRALLHWGALAHDVGKLSVPPELLNKPGRPTDEEWRQLRNHPLAAFELAAPLRPWLGSWVDAATQHHERYDGDGYPLGLSGDDIHISGRIVAVADAFDTMTSARSYKKPLPFEEARAELTRASGTQFDPDVVRAFMTVGVRRLRLVGGPLAWLTSLPSTTAITTATTTSGGAGAALAGAALAVSSVVGLGAPTQGDDGSVNESAGIERAVDGPDGVEVDPLSEPVEPMPADAPTPVSTTTTTPSTTLFASTTTVPGTSSTTTTTSSAPTTTTTITATTTTAAPTTTTTTTTTTTAAPGVGLDCASVQEGLRPLTGLDLVNCDLSGLDLTNQSLVDADMDGADLTGAVLAGAKFTGGEFAGVQFTNADLRGAILRDADFDASVFDGADLTAADMRNSDFDDGSFVGADLTDARLNGSGIEFVDFTDALLVRVQLGNANLQGADLTRARLTAATGLPNDHDLATWVNTECPSGVVQSTDCYA